MLLRPLVLEGQGKVTWEDDCGCSPEPVGGP